MKRPHLYNIGETVHIKVDFNIYRYDDDPSIDTDMYQYAGQDCAVDSQSYWHDAPMYKLSGNSWTWDERWLEPVANVEEVDENEWDDIFKE